jgi:hypothetical protein
MKIRNVIVGVVALLCLTAVWATVAQHQQIITLRAEQQRLGAESEQPRQLASLSSPTPESSANPSQPATVSSELLRLRGEVGVLTRRRRELDGVERENERLRLQFASTPSSNAPGPKLSPGYIRKNQAQMAGYNSPEDTLQTFLWAMANHNYQAILDALSPQAAQQFATNMPVAQSSNLFHEVDTTLPGLGVVGRKDLPDGGVELTVEMAPGIAQPMRFERLNGQWKIGDPGL